MSRSHIRIRDIVNGNIYAVRRAVWTVDPDGTPDGEFTTTVAAATVVCRHRDEGRWTVTFADGKEMRVAHHQILGRWDDHLADVDVEAAADRLRHIAVDLGWVDDDPLGATVASVLFGGPVGPVRDGTVTLRLTADQAHQIADLLRTTEPDPR